MNSNPLQIDEYEQQSLYSFNNEHDACGVGLVLNLYGEKSHEIVEKGLQVPRKHGSPWSRKCGQQDR